MANQPHLLVGPGDVHEIALLPGDPGRVERIAAQCDDTQEISRNREYALVNATYRGTPLTICSTGIGSPSAAVAVEELHRVGVETVIRPGTCGALQSGIGVGDLVVVTGAAKDEGTTKRYEAETVPAVPAYPVLAALVEAAEADESVHIGPIATDDAFYAETDVYVRDWEAAGLLAVEMEAAAIMAIARRHGMAAGALCTVDGNLVEGTKKGETDEHELPDAARAGVERMIHVALEAVAALGSSDRSTA